MAKKRSKETQEWKDNYKGMTFTRSFTIGCITGQYSG